MNFFFESFLSVLSFHLALYPELKSTIIDVLFKYETCKHRFSKFILSIARYNISELDTHWSSKDMLRTSLRDWYASRSSRFFVR